MDQPEKTTVRTAAKALAVSEKTVLRYIERGLLTRIKDGHRVYLLSDEVRQLRRERHASERTKITKQTTITLTEARYAELLSALADAKSKCNYLLEYKTRQEKTERQLEQSQDNLVEVNKWFSEAVNSNKAIRAKSALQGSELNQEKNEVKELRNNLAELRKELAKMKNRNIFERIRNK